MAAEPPIYQHDDDQILAELRDATHRDADMDDPAPEIADLLDDPHTEPAELIHIDAERMRLVMLYARLGRNAFIRYLMGRQ